MSVRTFARALDLSDVDDQFTARFWANVDRRGPDECWLWTGHRKRSGYGQFTVCRGSFMTASRVALALTLGRLDEGTVACHTCDNPPCVNPTHLFAGTQADNALDSVAKGRARRARGEQTHSARLTEADVIAIRAHPHQYGLIQRLADKYGVSGTVIRKVRSHRTWRHVAARTSTLELCVRGHLLNGKNRLDVADPSAGTVCATCAEAYRISRLRRAS